MVRLEFVSGGDFVEADLVEGNTHYCCRVFYPYAWDKHPALLLLRHCRNMKNHKESERGPEAHAAVWLVGWLVRSVSFERRSRRLLVCTAKWCHLQQQQQQQR